MLPYLWSTLKHKALVARFMVGFAARLTWRALVHDNSKFWAQERGIYAKVVPGFEGLEYGSPAYRAHAAKLGPKAHVAANSHHPEHYPQGVRGMTLLDVVEMSCDWRAAAQRGNTNPHQSVEISRKRFAIDDQLNCILHNSVKEKR